MPGSATDNETIDAGRIGEQTRLLPGPWRVIDRCMVRGTEIAVAAIGGLFTILIVVEVLSRYVFKFSLMFVNAGSRFLLVWFFLIGAGLALRHGAHAGFDLLVARLAPERRRAAILIAQALAMLFFGEMLWAGIHSLGPAWRQIEPGLEIRLFWAFLAIPAGFLLLIYHQAVLMTVAARRVGARDARS